MLRGLSALYPVINYGRMTIGSSAAHEERETVLGTMMFFVGFLAFLVVGMTLG